MCVHPHLCMNGLALARDVRMETESSRDDCIKDVEQYLFYQIMMMQRKVVPFMPLRGCFHLKVSTAE